MTPTHAHGGGRGHQLRLADRGNLSHLRTHAGRCRILLGRELLRTAWQPRPTAGSGRSGRTRRRCRCGGNLTFTALEAGNDHTCGLTAQGVMYCWGTELPAGSSARPRTTASMFPIRRRRQCRGNLTFTDLAAGANHTCGVAGGAVYCWGGNYEGRARQLTDLGGKHRHPTPAVVDGLPAMVSLSPGDITTARSRPQVPPGAGATTGSVT